MNITMFHKGYFLVKSHKSPRNVWLFYQTIAVYLTTFRKVEGLYKLSLRNIYLSGKLG